MASPRLLSLLLVVPVACGDDVDTSASDSQTSTGDSTTTTTGNTGNTVTGPTVPTTGDAGSESASESETGGPTSTGSTETSAVSASETGTTDTTTTTTDSTTDTTTTGTTDTTTTTDTTSTSTSDTASTSTSDTTSTTDTSTSDTTTTTGCVDACDDGALQCVGDAVQACEVGEGGCLEWSAPDPCAANEVCEDGACVLGCTDACAPGASQCSGGGVTTCVDDPMSGCTVWSDAVACGPNEVCLQGECVLPPPACLDDCVFTKQTVPGGVDFYSVWGADAEDVWVVGASGVALHYDGVNWKSIDSGIGKRLECVHGSASDDAYAIANDGAIIRWDGVEWTPYVDLNPIWESSACISVLGEENMLALVYDENGEKQVLWHVEGGLKTQLAVWTPQAVFTPNGSKIRTISLRAFSETQALITADRALRWDGVSITNTGAPNPSFGLWALAPNLAYAAASHSGIGHRWDGATWKIVNPNLDGYMHMFTGTAGNRVFGVGESQTGVAAITAFDGIGWVSVPAPADAKALFAGWSAPTGEVFAVGKAGTVLIGQ